ncbi:UNVERIFIED_CONTAM: hypothetical protein Sradi_2636600 [Sesamum radiatum]|uniref:Uncharacterized protein n=1 Tax=Sesamum radiatum TaxID=300843 RepID=A0AAW2S5A2_SESRA
MVVGGSSGASTSGATEGYVSVQPELLTIYEPCDWLSDTKANVHVCADKSLFVSYQAISGSTVSMGNSSTAEVLRIRSVDLKFPSGRIPSLKRVHHEETPRYSPSSNGLTEWKNRTFKDMINSLLLIFELPKYLWGENLDMTCHILNRVPLKHNMSTPFELWNRKPTLKYFRVWRCLAKVLVSEHKRKKLGSKTINVAFLGYVETSYALRFMVIKSEILGIEVNTIVKFRDVIFLEDVFSMKTGITSIVSLDDSLASTFIPEHVEKMSNVGVNPSNTSLTHEELDETRRIKRARVVKDFGSDFVTYNNEDDLVTFKDGLLRKQSGGKKLSKVRWTILFLIGTWVLVDLPAGYTTIGYKWIFKKKLKPNGTVESKFSS